MREPYVKGVSRVPRNLLSLIIILILSQLNAVPANATTDDDFGYQKSDDHQLMLEGFQNTVEALSLKFGLDENFIPPDLPRQADPYEIFVKTQSIFDRYKTKVPELDSQKLLADLTDLTNAAS